MSFGVAPAKINSLVVEDDKDDRLHIARKLKSTPAFQPVFYNNYQKYPLMQKALDADIVSLDLEVENRKAESLFICKQLNKRSPDKSVIFFTFRPQDVLGAPINFVLEKSNEVWAAYDRLLLMIVVHDRSLSVLRDIVELSPEPKVLKKQYEEIRERLSPFLSSLATIYKVFENENKTVARRYRKLGRILKKMNSVAGDERKVYFTLHDLREPLRGLVKEELDEIKKVEGVFVTDKLKKEIDVLDESIAKQEPVKDTRGLAERALVYAADTIVDSLKSVSALLSSNKPADTEQAPETEQTIEESLYINAWFHDYEDKNALTVDVAAELRINLAYLRRTDGASELLPSETAALLNAAGAVDVMVMSPMADIDPLIETLELPPKPDQFVKFSVIAKQPGQIDLTVLLMIRNEPIYRTVFSCEAVKVTAAPVA